MRKKATALMTALGAAGLLCAAQMNMAFAEEVFSYEDVADLQFYFSSGAGGWWTELRIHEDGTFEGYFHDSDMGDTGDGYPDGTVYVCDFSGQFGEPEKINEYTYSARIENIELAKEPDTLEIIDGIRYINSEPYGLDGAESVLFYLEGAPLAELPEGYRSWVHYYDLDSPEETELPFIGLYNEAEESGFSSYEADKEEGSELSDGDIPVYPDLQRPDSGDQDSSALQQSAIDLELTELVEKASEIEEQIQDGLLSQQELNQLSRELYTLWDDELNSLWRRIKEILPKEEMDQLTAEELQWIDDKESEVAKAGAEFEGGSMQPFIENSRAADITRMRVYELADYLR